MRVDDILYFSSTVKFEALNFDDKKILIDAFKKRVDEFYFKPAEKLDDEQICNAFAVGVLCASTIDFLAKIKIGINEVGNRIEKWLECYIDEFSNNEENNKFAKRFYKDFRNGLVHEGLIKHGGQFSYNFKDKLICEIEGIIIINPRLLLIKTKVAFEKMMDEIEEDNSQFQQFKKMLKKDFKVDIEYAKNSKPKEILNS